MPVIHEITRRRALEFLWSETDGRVFSADFQKVDGTMRKMTARRGVRKYLKGGKLRYDPKPRLLVPVFDMRKGEHRNVNVGTLSSFRIGGETFVVID